MNLILDNWGVLVSVISAISVLAINNYKTKKNTSDIERIKDEHISLVCWDKARETFVSKELHDNQMDHIDLTLSEIKLQNQQILEKLISK